VAKEAIDAVVVHVVAVVEHHGLIDAFELSPSKWGPYVNKWCCNRAACPRHEKDEDDLYDGVAPRRK
jgi:hypothetical protein